MTDTEKILSRAACTLMLVLGVLGGLFAAGYAFADLSTGAAIGSTAASLLPTLALVAVAVWARRVGPVVLVVVTTVVAVFNILNSALGLLDRNEVGPVVSIAVLGVGVALGVLGLHRPTLAGWLLLGLGVAQLLATAVGFVSEWRSGGGPGPLALLTTSSGIVVVPILVAGALDLAGGAWGHRSATPRGVPPRHAPVH
jgi:hypothetical protein